MLAFGERDDDLFDFTEQVFGQPAEEVKEERRPQQEKAVLTTQSEIHTSYILVNALLNLLVRKGIIYPHEVQSIVAELYEEYIKKKRGGEG
jgi:hypothetical protein